MLGNNCSLLNSSEDALEIEQLDYVEQTSYQPLTFIQQHMCLARCGHKCKIYSFTRDRVKLTKTIHFHALAATGTAGPLF
jgi:hypothetical protein